ncbi:hypothetical protein Tco_0712650, partial [Tanacetum coccineum]
TNKEYAQVKEDEFINISFRHVDSSNMHTFYQHPSEHRWTKDHPLEKVIGHPSQSVRTRRQLETDGEMSRPTEKHLNAVKRVFRYLKNTINMGLWYPKDTSFELTAFLDSDHASCLDSRMSTSGGIQFLRGDKLVSWSSKKHECTSMSLAEAKYVSLSACCAQVLWLRTQLTDYGFHFDKIPMYCDSKAAIAISCNLVQHSRTKHIDVRYHFIKEHVEKGIVELFFVGTKYQLADLFTKALSEDRFKYLVRRLGMRCLTPEELRFWQTHLLDPSNIEFNTYNNGKNLSEIQLEHEKKDELVTVLVKVVHELDCMMVVKEIENGLVEELEQDIADEGEEDEEEDGGEV